MTDKFPLYNDLVNLNIDTKDFNVDDLYSKIQSLNERDDSKIMSCMIHLIILKHSQVNSTEKKYWGYKVSTVPYNGTSFSEGGIKYNIMSLPHDLQILLHKFIKCMS